MKVLLVITALAVGAMAQQSMQQIGPHIGQTVALGLSQKAPPDPVLPIGCTMSNLAGCVPHYTGDEPMQTDFSLPYQFTAADCPTTLGATPGAPFTYPGDASPQNHVWCPGTFAHIQSILQSPAWQQGDIIALQPQSTSVVYASALGAQFPGRCIKFVNWGSQGTGCDLNFPATDNPNHKYSYLITMNYAQLAAPGTRVGPADLPNMAKIDCFHNALCFVFGHRVNHWRIVGIEMEANNDEPICCAVGWWQKGYITNLIRVEPWNANGGRRDLWAMNNSKTDCYSNPAGRNADCDYLGLAIEISMKGQGAMLSVNPSSIAVGTTGSIVVTTQDSHMCDASGGVTCASVNSSSPTRITFGFGIVVNSTAVANVTCPAMVANPSSTCQTITANVTVSTDAASMGYSAVTVGGRFIGNGIVRMPLIATRRSDLGYVDEYMMLPRGLLLTGPNIPLVYSIENTTSGYNNYPIIGGTGVTGTITMPAQTFRFTTTNTTMLAIANPNMTGQSIVGLANGAFNFTGFGVAAQHIASDTEVDITAPSYGHPSLFGGRINSVIVQGNGIGPPWGAPVAQPQNDNFFLIPTTNLAKWIQSIDCWQMLPGETYTCNVVGAHTTWGAGTTFRFSTQLLNTTAGETDSQDVQVTNATISDATHAQLTVKIDARAGEGASYIMFDRVDVHGILMKMQKDTLTGAGSVPGMWIWSPQRTGSRYAVGIQDLFNLGGRYVGIRDSVMADASFCPGWAGPDVAPASFATCNESHVINDNFGPGPKWMYNNEIRNSSISAFNGGASADALMASNVQNSDIVYIRNWVHNTDDYLPPTVFQVIQGSSNVNGSGNVFRYGATNIQTVVDAAGTSCGTAGCISGFTPIPTGWNACPWFSIAAAPAGGTNAVASCSVTNPGPNGVLNLTLTNHGAGYTTPPLLTLQYYPLGGVKNNFENKAGNRVLYYGNIGSNTWNNSMQAQQGSWLLLSPLSNMADGYPMSYIHNITVADNWMDRNFNAVIIGFNNGCSGIFAAKGVQPWSMANVYGCMPPWDPWGVITAPTWAVPGGYSSSGLAGGGAPYNVYVVNNLVTGRDIVTDDEAMIPSEAIWSGRGGSYRFQTPLVLQMGAGVTYLHNTLEKRPSYGIANSVGPYNNQSNLLSFGWWAGTPSGTAGSILFNTYFWSNVMQCIPYADTIGSGSAATNWVQTVIGCPTKGSGTDAGKCVATEAGGGQDSEKHFWGNVMYDDRTATVGCQASTLAGFDATWNFNGRTNNYRDATYTSSTQPNKYANISLYLPGQRPGDWTLNDTAATTALNGGSAGLPPNAATPGIDNAALMAAIGQTTPADIPMVITGNWSGAVIPTFFSISGTVTGASASVSMTLQPGNMTTTASPNYTFASVPENGIYTITPVLTNCTFTPPSITTAALTGNLTGQNFSASCVTPPIPTPPAALHTGKIGPP